MSIKATRSVKGVGLRAALVAAVVGGSSGCELDLLNVQAEVEEVCLTELLVEVPAAQDVSIEETFEHEGIELDLPEGFDASVHLVGGMFALESGVDDFAFLQHLHVRAAAVDAPELPAVTLVDVAGEEIDTSDRDLFLPGNDGVDLADYVNAGALEFTVGFEGDLPEEAWSMSAEVCFTVRAEYREPLPF